MRPLRINNTDRQPRIHILPKHQAGHWNTLLNLAAPDNQHIHLSRVHSHFCSNGYSSLRRDGGHHSTVKQNSAHGPLRYLAAFLHQIGGEYGSIDRAMTMMEQLGRETTELLVDLQDHFINAPATAGLFDYEVVNRTNLSDVRDWLMNHLKPLAEERKRELSICIDSRLATLPVNPLYGLIIEHLRKRIYTSSPNGMIDLTVSLNDNNILVDITEYGESLGPTPITDETTRHLWSRVIHLLCGSIVWRNAAPYRGDDHIDGNLLRISYPLTHSTRYIRSLSPLHHPNERRSTAA